MSPGESAPLMSSFKKVGAIEGGIATTPPNAVRCSASATAVDDEHADQQRAGNTPRRQHRHERQRPERKGHGRRRQWTERHERAGRIDDDAAPLEADQRDQQPDAGADRVFERIRHGDDDAFAKTNPCGEDEHGARDRDRAERDRPRRAARGHDREREEEIVTHRRRHADRVVGEERHEQRRHGRRETGGGEHGPVIHAGLLQDRRLHEDDVGHRQERRQAGEHFGADGRSRRGQMEEPVQHGAGKDTASTRPAGHARAARHVSDTRRARLDPAAFVVQSFERL